MLVDATGEQLAGALRERPDLVKVNLAEACSAVGQPGATCRDEKPRGRRSELVAEGVELRRRLVAAGAVGAVVTLGAAGAVGVLGGADWQRAHAPSRRREPRRLRRLLRRGAHPGARAAERTRRRRCRLAAGAAAANAASPYNGHVDPALARELAGGACAGPPVR